MTFSALFSFLYRLLWRHFECLSSSLLGLSPAFFVIVAHLFALLTLPNGFGKYKVSKQPKTAPKWEQNGAGTHIFGPFFHRLMVPEGSTLRGFGKHRLSKRANYASTRANPKWSGITLENNNNHFGPVLNPF